MAGPNDALIAELLNLQGTSPDGTDWPDQGPDYMKNMIAMLQAGNDPPPPLSVDTSLIPAPTMPTPMPLLDPDSLFADANGHNLPRTGTANSTGAVERINAASPKWHPGVTATIDAKGSVSVTNADASGNFPTGTVRAPSISNDLFSAIDKLKATSNPDIARGLLSDIRQTAAAQSASIVSEAMRFGANKLGIPFLEQQLAAAEASDRATPGWYAGIGDSPGTKLLRAQLLTTRASVDNEAKNYLAGNSTYAGMNASLKTAEEEAKRIDTLSSRKAALTDRVSLEQQIRESNKVDEANAITGSLSPDMQKRLLVLNPTLSALPDATATSLATAATVKRMDAPTKEALASSTEDLPLFALAKNPAATTLTVSTEQELNGSTPEITKAKLKAIDDLVNSKEFIRMAVAQKFNGMIGSNEAKSYALELGNSGVGLGVKERADMHQRKFAMALDMYRKDATNRFVADTSTWGIQDKTFLTAQADSFKTTGSRSMENVLASFTKTDDPATDIKLHQKFSQLASDAANSQGKSLFGSPSSIDIQKAIAASVRLKGSWQSMFQMLQTMPQTGMQSPVLGVL